MVCRGGALLLNSRGDFLQLLPVYTNFARDKMKPFRHILPLFALLLLLGGCRPMRFVPEDGTMLRSVKLKSTDKSLNAADFRAYVRQDPNAKWFGLMKVPMGIYCLSPADTTRRKGRFFRRNGEAPVVYDAQRTGLSCLSIAAAMQSRGYLRAEVVADTLTRSRKTDVTYTLRPGPLYYIRSVERRCDDAAMADELAATAAGTLLRAGKPLAVEILQSERSRVVNALQNRGYYRVNREFVRYEIDTLRDDYGVTVRLVLARPAGIDSTLAYRKFRYRNVEVSTMHDRAVLAAADSSDGVRCTLALVGERKVKVLKTTGRHDYLRRSVLYDNVAMRPDSLFSERAYQNTYSALNALQALSYSSIRLREVGRGGADSLRAAADTAGTEAPALLDAEITLYPSKRHTISAELEGTNTNGDLGAAAVLSYTNRNLFRGAEVLQLKVRGAYEAITGLEGYNDANYIEYGAEASLRFPAIRRPFTLRRRKGAARGGSLLTTDVRLMFDSQDRPEFHRRVLTGNWAYRWHNTARPRLQHRYDIVSLNYVFMPWISDAFRHDYLEGDDPRYSILRSTYENQFIMATAYSLVFTKGRGSSAQSANPFAASPAQAERQVRFKVETAGNVLYAFSKLTRANRNPDGQYEVLNNSFSQYVRTELDFTRHVTIDERNTFALHAYFGLALPYGNSFIIPYEKRFFSGGANSVRGWSVRELGPGGYKGEDGKVDFVNQTGNLKLDFSVEWRTHLFWKFDGAAFVDAGNVWNTRRYKGFEDGQWRWNRFYKQIAVAYGLGLRFNLDYFVLRFDCGMKALDPTHETGKAHFPIIHPRFSRDFAFHFAVGLPF